MDGLNLYITVSAVALGLLSAVLNFTGRQKYKDNASFFESSNHELREQNTTYRSDNASLKEALAKAQAESTQKDKTIEQLKPFSELAKVVSNNHKEVLTTMSINFSKVMTVLTGKLDGK